MPPPDSSASRSASTPAGPPARTPVETVRKIADLARLDLAANEEEALARQFERILEQFRVLEKLDVSGAEESSGATLGASRLADVVRPDVPKPSLPVDEILANAPAHTTEFYVVPKTVGGEG